jgi:hypothetical protein
LNTEIGTPGLNTSKKASHRSHPKQSVNSYNENSVKSKAKLSQTSIQDIKIIPIEVSPSTRLDPTPSNERSPHILSNDVSDIYRVINSDIQNKKSRNASNEHSKNNPNSDVPSVSIENNNLEKNKQEYMSKMNNNKFQNDLKKLDFTEDLNKDDDMNKMKEHVKKLQVIRMEKQRSGVDSSKEIQKETEKMNNEHGTLVQVENVKINLETLGIEPMDSKNNTRPLSIENDFIPELIDSRTSNKHKARLDSSPKIIAKNNLNSLDSKNKLTNDFSNNSNTYYEKRNNGSIFDQSNEKPNQDSMRNNYISKNPSEEAKKKAESKGNQYSEESERKALYTYGADSNRR